MLGTARGKGSSKALRRKALAVFWDLQGPVRMRRKTGGGGGGGGGGRRETVDEARGAARSLILQGLEANG